MPIPSLGEIPVLVTGGAGFIGSHLVDALVERGAKVRVLDNLASGSRDNLSRHENVIDFREGDIRDLAICREACAGMTYVFHQAALGSVPRSIEDPTTSLAVNAQGTANVFTAAREAGARRLVYASSSSVYGDTEQLPKEEGGEGDLLSPYALSKRMNEETAEVFARCYGFETVGLRYFNIYGPRQSPSGPYAAVIPLFFQAALENHSARIHGDGGQSRDFTFVDDAVLANLMAAGAPAEACGRAYNVAPGSRLTVASLEEQIRTLVGSTAEPEFGPSRPGDVRHSQADPSNARSAMGFEATTSLEQGLQATLAFYRNNHQ